MHVKRLQVKNIRSFKWANLNFTKGININTGVNNSGKSTIIKSLYKLQSAYVFKLEDLRAYTDNSILLVEIENISEQESQLFKNSEKNQHSIPANRVVQVLFLLTRGRYWLLE